MSEQMSFFDSPTPSRANARNTDPPTSHEAAESVRGSLRETQEAVMQAATTFLLNFTDVELIETYNMMVRRGDLLPQSPSGIRTRRKELCDAGRVRDSGKTTKIGNRNHTCWEVVDEQYR